jgi:hypothetical protein
LLSGTFGNDESAANQIALSLASLIYVCHGFECGCTIEWKSERTYGLCEIAAWRDPYFISHTLETVFCCYFVVFHQYLPPFVNVNDMRHVVETKEVD